MLSNKIRQKFLEPVHVTVITKYRKYHLAIATNRYQQIMSHSFCLYYQLQIVQSTRNTGGIIAKSNNVLHADNVASNSEHNLYIIIVC